MNMTKSIRRYYRMAVGLIVFSVGAAVNSEATAIVNNVGNSGEDSLSVAVVNWDSAGCVPISADSFWVCVFRSDVNNAVFIDSGTTTMTGMDTVRVAGKTVYYFHRAVSDIDGGGAHGHYTGRLLAKNSTLGLYSVADFSFQVVGWELNDMGDSAAFAARLYDSLVIKGRLLDSLYAILDSVQNQDDWISTFDASTETVALAADAFSEMADTLFGRDSALFDEGFWHKLASRADSGAAGQGADSGSIANWVWNTPQANHTAPGTFGKYLDSEVSGIGTGTGALSHSIVAYDSCVGQVIPGVTVAIRNLDQTSLLAVGATSSSGVVSFNLDGDDYLAVAWARAYLFETYKLVTVTGGEADTVYGALFDPGAPPSPDLCRVYGFVFGLTGEPESGVNVGAALPAGVVQSNGLIVSPTVVSTTTDSAGYFYLDLIPSSMMAPTGTQYEISISRADGAILRQRATVPNVDSWQLDW